MKDIKVGDKIEVEISRITLGLDKKIYIGVKSDLFENDVEFSVRNNRFVWQAESGRVVIK